VVNRQRFRRREVQDLKQKMFNLNVGSAVTAAFIEKSEK
jgi:hypothetical protein